MRRSRQFKLLTIVYVVTMILSMAGTPAVHTPVARAAEAPPAPQVDPARPDGQQPPYCGDADDPYLGVGVTRLSANSAVFGLIEQENPPGPTAIGGPIRVIPGEVIKIEFIIINTTASTNITNINGMLVIFHDSYFIDTMTFTSWSGGDIGSFTGTLGPGESVEGYVEYTARAVDPQRVNYAFWGFGTAADGTGGRCDKDFANTEGIEFFVEGPSIDLDLSIAAPNPSDPRIEVGAPIDYTLTITNNRPLATTIDSIDDIVFETSTLGTCTPVPPADQDTLEERLLAQAGTNALPASAGSSLQVTFTCNMLAVYPDPLTNNVSVVATASTTAGDVSLPFTVSASVGKATPAISVVKFANVTQATVGDTITYTLRVTNDGDTPLNNVTVIDSLTAHLLNVPGGTLAVGQSYEETVDYIVKENDPDPLVNIVTAIATSPQGATVRDSWTLSLDKRNPALQLQMSVSPDAAAAGETVTYTFDVTNTSNETLVNVRVEFPLCQQPGIVSGCSGNRVLLGAPPSQTVSLLAGTTVSGSVQYTVQGTEPDPFGFTTETTGIARALTTSGATITDTDSVFLDILSSIIQIESSADRETALRGDTITYSFVVTNLSGSQQRILTITDSLLGTIGNMPPGGLLLDPGETYEFQVPYTVSGSDLDPLVNITTVTAEGDITDSTTTVVDISDAQLFIQVVTVPPDEQEPPLPVDYQIFISNNGLITLNNVTGYIQFVGTTEPETPLAIDFPGPGGPTLSAGTLAPFELATATHTRAVQSDDPDPLTALVRVQGTDDQGQQRNFFGSVTINILPTRLQLRKVANATRAGVGDQITYEFFVTNAADSDIVDISVTDDLCADAVGGAGCDTTTVLLAPYDPGTGATTGPFDTTIPRLQPGEMAYGTFDYIVTNDDLLRPEQTLTNQGRASGTLEATTESVGDVSQWNISVVNPLVIEKLANRLIASDGQCVTYSFRVSNIGSVTEITSITLTDNKLGDLTGAFPPFTLVPGDSITLEDSNPSCTGATQYQVTSADIPRLDNTVTALGDANGQTLTATDAWSIAVTPPIVVEKTNTAPFFGAAVVGDLIRYEVTITNFSDTPYTFVSARDVSNSAYETERNFNINDLIANSDNPADPALEPGESTTLEYFYEVGPNDPDQLINTFEVAMSNGLETLTFSDSHTMEIYSPFGILKIPDRFFAVVGETIHYDYLIYNISQITMLDVTVVDDRLGPVSTRLLDQTGTPVTGYTTAPRDLPPAGDYPCVVPLCAAWLLESDPAAHNYTVQPADLVSDKLVNTVTVTGTTTVDSREAGVPIVTTDSAEVQIANPLRITKIGPLQASRGDAISYVVTVQNTSPLTSNNIITDIAVVDSLTGLVTMSATSLQPGEIATGVVNLVVPENASDPLVNTVTATGNLNIDGTIYGITSLATASVDLDDPVLDVTLTANVDTAERNTTVTWSARLVNNGTSDLTNLTYSDSTGTDFTNFSDCPTDLPQGGTPVFCSWQYTFTLSDPDPYVNQLTVQAETLGGNTFTGGDEFTVDLIDPRFRVSKVATPNIAFIGDTVTYTITVTNTSNSVLNNVTAFDSLTGPVALQFPSGIDGVLNDSESATAQVTYTLSQADPNPLVNEVYARGESVAGGLVLEDRTYTNVLITSSRLLVEKQVSRQTVQTGETFTYNIAITNIGQLPIRNIQVLDEAVGLDTSVNPNTCGGTVTHNSQTYDVTCTVNTPLTIDPIDALNPFEVAFLTYTVEATPGLPDPFINTAQVTGNDDQGNTIEGSDTVAVDILTPGITLTKTPDRAGAAIGDTITYMVTLTNTTGGDLTNVQVIDNELGTPVQMSLEGAPFADTIAVMQDGQTAMGVINYTVTRDTPNPFVNTVTVTNDQGLTDGAAASVDIRDLGIVVNKRPRNASALIGDVITYDIEVQNTSSQTLRAVTAIDQLTGDPVVLQDPATSAVITELGPGETAVGTFTYTVPPDVADPLVNRVTASGRADSGITVSSSGLALVDIREADVSISKTASVSTALIGDAVTYDIVVTNEGNSPLTNIVVTDPLCATADSGCASATEVFSVPTLDAGESASGQITRTVRADDPDPLINTALVTALTNNGATIQDSDSASVEIVSSTLLVSKTVLGVGACSAPPIPQPAADVGDIVAYEVRVENLGTDTISNIQVVDITSGSDLTALLFPGVTPPATPTLGAFGTVSTCIETLVTPTSPDPLVNTVVASGLLNGVTPISDSASASIPLASGDLIITNVPSQSTARLGDTITYTVTVRNTGFSTLNNVVATSLEAGGPITLGTSTLSPGQSTTGTYTHTIGALDADPFSSTATVTADGPNLTTLSDSATATVDIVADGVRLTKQAAPTLAPAGTDIVYTLTITNTGTTNITSLSVIDPLLGGDITGCFDPATPLPDPAPLCTPPASSPLPLTPGSSITATIRHTLSTGDGDPAINTAVVTAQAVDPADPAGTVIFSDTATARVDITGNGLLVTKTADRGAAFDGDTITYTVEVLNTSTTTVTGLTMVDTLVPGLFPPQNSLAPGERMSMTYTHTVNAALDPDPLVNLVSVSGRDAVGILVNDTSSASVAILGSDAIRVIVTADRTSVLANQTINYLATITNIGTEQLTGITAIATLHDGSTVDLTGQLATTTLNPGQSVSATFSYDVTTADRSPVVASVTAEGTGATVGTVSDTGQSSVEIRISSMRVSASPNNCGFPCIGIPGDVIGFTATIRNTGATTLTNVSLTSNQPVVFEQNPTGLILTPGQVYTVDFEYTVPFNAPNPVRIALTAQGIDPIGTTVVSPNYNYLLATANPRIAVTLTSDRTSTLDGQPVNYTATIENVGTEPLLNLALVDSLVGGLTDQILVSTLNPGQSTTVEYSYTPGTASQDPLVNTVTVSGTTTFGRSVTDNDTLAVNILRPQLYVSLVADRQVAILGERINYTVNILNVGDGPINNLTGTFLVDRSVVSGGMLMSPAEQGGGIVLGTTSLPQGAATSGFFSYIANSGDPNPLTMRATITGNGIVGETQVAVSGTDTETVSLILFDANGNPISVPPPIIGFANPEVTKQVSQPFVVPGGLVTWSMTVRNPGSETLTSVIMTDTLDIKMTVESVTIDNGTIEAQGNTVVATTNPLEFNQTATLTIVARVNEGVIAGALLQNTGCAASVGGNATVCDTAAVRIAPDAELLPATGEAAPPASTSAAGSLLGITAILILGGWLSLQLQDRRTLMIVAAIVAAIVIVVALASVLRAPDDGTPEAALPATEVTDTGTAPPPVTELPPTDTPEGAEPTRIPPTAIPIPTAAGTLPSQEQAPAGPPPFTPLTDREIFIPKLGLGRAVPIVNVPLRNRTWDVRDLGQNVGFLQGTTWLDEAAGDFGGNTVLAGHIQLTDAIAGPFRDLDLLEIGDSIFIADHGAIYEFQVSEIDVVPPDDVGVTYPTDNQTLTLITCTAWNAFRGVFAERLVVRAQPVRSMVYQ
ncbi:MAG: hypothetical protein Kow0077_07730 [Anaerolineae bacterium]